MNCRVVQEDIATALLTGSEVDRPTQEHIDTCPACAAEQASLRQVLGVMALASTADVQSPPAVPANDLLLARTLAAAAQERADWRRRARMGWVLAAAALVILIAATAVGLLIFRPEPVISASASSASLSATVDIAKADAGSELRMSVTGIPDDTDCVISVTTADGRVIPVVSWRAEYEGTAHVSGMAPAAPASITRVTLAEPNGKVLLDIPISA